MRCHGIVLQLGLALLCAGGAWAGTTEEYVNGVEGIKAASLPPPGVYLRSYEVFYQADEVMDKNGNVEHVGFRANVEASAERGIWVTDKLRKYIGADYAAHIMIPLVHEDVDIARAHIGGSQNGVGDINVAPVILAWHKPKFDLVTDYEVFAPTANSGRVQDIGKGYWTHMFTFGGTGYLSKDKTWTFSLLSRYEIHAETERINYKPGQDVHFEWGAGKAFKQGFEVGIVGYDQWHVRQGHNSVQAAGPEANYMIKKIGLIASLRYDREFAANNRPEGNLTNITFTKRW